MKFNLKLPLLGFEDIHSMNFEKIDDIFAKLTTDDNPDISFTLINPFVLRDYQFEIPTGIQVLMNIDDSSNLLIYNIVIINSVIEKTTINFAAPLVFNLTNKTMTQVIYQIIWLIK